MQCFFVDCETKKLNYPRLQGEGFEITGRLGVDLTHSHSFVRHSCASRNPVFFFSVLDSRFHGNDNFDVIVFTCSWSASFQFCKGYVTKDWPTISQIFPSPQGEGFPPSPKGDIKGGAAVQSRHNDAGNRYQDYGAGRMQEGLLPSQGG